MKVSEVSEKSVCRPAAVSEPVLAFFRTGVIEVSQQYAGYD
jgi:hypothetical protein